MRSRRLLITLCLVVPALGAVTSVVRAEPDAFIGTLTNGSGTLTIGQRTAFTPPSSPIPPTAPITGPVTTGTIKGQFDFTCGEGGTPANCPDAAYAAAHLNFKWGALQVSDYSSFPSSLSATFVSVGGKTLFSSDVLANGGFTSVETQGFDGNPFTRLAHIQFSLEGAGVTLQPGYSYVLFAVLSEFPIPDTVPNIAPGVAEGSIFQSSYADGPPFQFHQAFPLFDPDQNLNELATSALIPVTPEPMSGLLLVIGGIPLIYKHRNRNHL